MNRTERKAIVLWTMVFTCAVVVTLSVMLVGNSRETTCGRWLYPRLHPHTRTCGGPTWYWVIKIDGNWEAVYELDEDLAMHLLDSHGSFSVRRDPSRSGFWAPTRAHYRGIRYYFQTQGSGAIAPTQSDVDRMRESIVREELQGYYSTSPTYRLFMAAMNNPPTYTAERTLWWGYVHNALFVLSIFGAFVGTPMAVITTRRWSREDTRLHESCCTSCGYSLVGLEEGSPCPECGKSIMAEEC